MKDEVSVNNVLGGKGDDYHTAIVGLLITLACSRKRNEVIKKIVVGAEGMALAFGNP